MTFISRKRRVLEDPSIGSCFLIEWRKPPARAFFREIEVAGEETQMLEESWSGNAIRRDSVSSLLFRRNILIAGTRKRHASSGTPVSLGQTPIGFQLIRPRIELCRIRPWFWKTNLLRFETYYSMKSAVTIFRRISLRKDKEDIAISIVTKVEKNSRRRKDDGRRRVEKRKSLPLFFRKIFSRVAV